MIGWKAAPPRLPILPWAELRPTLRANLDTAESIRLRVLASRAPVVIVGDDVRAAIGAHLGDAREERGGLLVGTLYAREPGRGADAVRAIRLELAIPALETSASGISLRMETGLWTRAGEALGETRVVAGWYHSHPGLGAFFSETDRATQRAFFPYPYSLGWVIDPTDGGEAWFLGGESAALGGARVFGVRAPGPER